MKRAGVIVAVLALLVTAPLALLPAYRFPAPKPFLGKTWRNPYAGVSGPFHRVNLHAHSRAWGGLTAGTHSPLEMAQAYARLGYGAAAISNYHQIASVEDSPLPLVPAYEHGLNVTKSHRLVLGAERAVLLDFPLSTRSMRQWILELLRETGVVALNHPSLRDGHSCRDLEALTGYQLVEVHNAYAVSLHEWDCALSAGRLAWAVGNDDAHSARDESIGVAWNMVATRELSARAVIDAVASGRSYVVRGERSQLDAELIGLERDGDEFVVRLTGPARIEWRTDGGVLRHAEDGVSSSRFTPHFTDHYVRVVVRTPRTELVLNPVVRQGAWTAPVATVDWPVTLAGVGAWSLGVAALARSTRPRRRLRLVSDHRRAA